MGQPALHKGREAPGDTRTFIGRRSECEALLAELQAGTRLLTIVGPSGMGKTRLARQVKAILAERDLPLGQNPRFCSLIDCQTANDVEAAVAEVMGLPDEPGAQLSREGAGSAPMLLVLDNVDHLRDEAAAVAANLCDHLERLQILVTSIAPLEVEWEVCFELGPLEPEDARALYLDRIRRAGHLPSTEEQPAIEALVGRLDRIPLAIELAAARVQELPPSVLLEQIGERFDLLQLGGTGRHASLRAALSLSWDLLLPREQEFLARASVFAGGFTLESARAILGPSPHAQQEAAFQEEGQVDLEILALVEGVMAKALLQRDESPVPRFSFYESVRDFAAQALRDAGKEAETFARHAAFFREQGLRHERQRVGGKGKQASIRWLRAERENLLAAHRRTLHSDPTAAVELGIGIIGVQQMLGAPATELEFFDSLADAARRSGNAALLVQVLLHRAPALMRHARIQRCREDLDEALALSRELNAWYEESQIRAGIGVLLAKVGELAQARVEMDAAMELATNRGDPLLEAVTHLGLSLIAINQGDIEVSVESSERALEIARREGSLSIEARALANLGSAVGMWGRFREGRKLLGDALAIAQTTDDRGSGAYLLVILGGFEVMAGELEAAERHLGEAFQMEETHGNRRYEAYGISSLGLIAFERGDLRQAEQRLSQAARLSEDAGDRVERAICLIYLAAVSALRSKLEEARRLHQEARAFFERVNDPLVLEAVELLQGFLDLGEVRGMFSSKEWARAKSLETKVRERLEAAPSRDRLMARPTRILHRLLERALLDPAQGSAALAEQLVLGPDGAWFEFGGGRRVPLETRESLRKMLLELARQRIDAPGVPLSSERLFEAGWSQRIHPDSAGRRVYTGIWTLRTFGLSTAILHDGEGYLLDPGVSVIYAD